MLEQRLAATSCRTLVAAYRRERRFVKGERIVFQGVGTRDVYNITAPFEEAGESVIAGRVESRTDECSEVVFFKACAGNWIPLERAPVFRLQDPFVTRIHGELVFGGVEVYPDAVGVITSWRTRFFKGRSLAVLSAFTEGPLNMKDIRLVGLPNGRIGIFTRPHGLPDARARIGYTDVASLAEVNARVIAGATLFDDQFLRDEWGGANEVHVLSDGLLGVLGHVAYRDQTGPHYHAMTFVLDPETHAKSAIRILAERSDFEEGPSKRPELTDVVFSGGLVREAGGWAWLYAGLSDALAGRIRIPDPFCSFETERHA